MAIQRAKDAEVLVDVASDPDPSAATDPTTKVGRATSIEVRKDGGAIELNQIGDDGMRQKNGLRDFGVSISVNFDPQDAGQQLLIDEMQAESNVIVHALYDGTSGYENVCVIGLSEGSLAAGEGESVTFELDTATGFVWNTV